MAAGIHLRTRYCRNILKSLFGGTFVVGRLQINAAIVLIKILLVGSVCGVNLGEHVEQFGVNFVNRRVDLVNVQLFVVSGVVDVSVISKFHKCR